MFDINEYFREIRDKAAELKRHEDGAIYLMSLNNRQRGTVAGVVCVLSNAQVAATHIVNHCHRLATEEEIAAWKQEQLEKAERERAERAAKQIKYNLQLQLPPWLQQPGAPLTAEIPPAVAPVPADSRSAKQHADRS